MFWAASALFHTRMWESIKNNLTSSHWKRNECTCFKQKCGLLLHLYVVLTTNYHRFPEQHLLQRVFSCWSTSVGRAKKVAVRSAAWHIKDTKDMESSDGWYKEHGVCISNVLNHIPDNKTDIYLITQPVKTRNRVMWCSIEFAPSRQLAQCRHDVTLPTVVSNSIGLIFFELTSRKKCLCQIGFGTPINRYLSTSPNFPFVWFKKPHSVILLRNGYPSTVLTWQIWPCQVSIVDQFHPDM